MYRVPVDKQMALQAAMFVDAGVWVVVPFGETRLLLMLA